MSIACRGGHSAAVCEDGSLLVWGAGERGQLGLGFTRNLQAPSRPQRFAAPVNLVAAGDAHTGIVTGAGDLLMCGAGHRGQLGLGDESDRRTPTPVDRALLDKERVMMVACGVVHTAALTESGGVFTFGAGGNGQLGHGSTKNQLAPTRVLAMHLNDEQIVMVDAGGAHTVALSKEGHVFTWGYGGDGQLGHQDRESLLLPRQVQLGWLSGDKVSFVAAGGFHTIALSAGGRLYSWGDGSWGQLGHGDEDERLVPTPVPAVDFAGMPVVMAACGGVHTLAVTHNGGLWACGRGGAGQLGLNDGGDRLEFRRVGMQQLGGVVVVAVAAAPMHSAIYTCVYVCM